MLTCPLLESRTLRATADRQAWLSELKNEHESNTENPSSTQINKASVLRARQHPRLNKFDFLDCKPPWTEDSIPILLSHRNKRLLAQVNPAYLNILEST